MSSLEENLNWYVVSTRPRWEKKVAQTLLDRGISFYCPLNKVNKQWSDRKKVVFEPLFKGYVFIQIEDANKWDIKKIDGILNYVYWLGKPAKVKESEIDNIRKFMNEFEGVEVIDMNIEKSSPVIIQKGVLMNYKGIVLEVLGNKARVQIDSMGVQLSAVFDKSALAVLVGFKV